MNTKTKRESGFTWIELAVVVSIVALLIALLLPAVSSSREPKRCLLCCQHQQEILRAIHAYLAEHGHLPPVYTTDKDGKVLHSWRVLILPYLKDSKFPTEFNDKKLYQKIKLDEPWDSEYNKQFHKEHIDYYHCPTSYYSSSVLEILEEGKCNYVMLPQPLPELTREKKTGEKQFLLLADMEKAFCWMNPAADISYEDFIQEMKETASPAQKINIRIHHESVRWNRLLPVINFGWLDGKATSVPLTDLHGAFENTDVKTKEK